MVFLDFWILFGFFGFFSKLLGLLLNVREVTTEHGKWPKISTNSVKSSFFAWRKKVLAEGRSPSQELEVSPSSGLYLVLLLNKLYFEGLRHPKLHRVGLWYWWFVYHNVGSNIFICNFFFVFFLAVSLKSLMCSNLSTSYQSNQMHSLKPEFKNRNSYMEAITCVLGISGLKLIGHFWFETFIRQGCWDWKSGILIILIRGFSQAWRHLIEFSWPFFKLDISGET